jgi:alpha-N-arabinofuranosidase
MHPADFRPWQEAPSQVQQTYRLIDTLVFGGLLITLIKHAARVRIACVAQLVNVIAPIMTATGGPVWKQGIYHPLLHGSLYGRGQVVALRFASPTYPTKEFGDVPCLDAVATRDPATGDLTIFAVNRHETEAVLFNTRLLGDRAYRLREHLVLTHPDPLAANTADAPDTLAPRAVTGGELPENHLAVALPPLSWNVLRLAPATSP